MTTRLNKHLALALGVSRREADQIISDGRVKVNGDKASVGLQVKADDDILVDEKPLEEKPLQYIAMNKPVGYLCSKKSQGAPTIYELLPPELRSLKTVGRLDKDSSGLILLTNDGDLSFKMTHPKFQKRKVYKARLDNDLEPLHQQMINDYGVNLEDGPSKLTLQRLSDDNRKDWMVIMSEGRNRQIRRTFSSLGYTVTKLHRTDFGSYSIGDIKPGKFQQINI